VRISRDGQREFRAELGAAAAAALAPVSNT
jgi:hypothetical protein